MTVRPLSELAISYCLEEDSRRRPMVRIRPSDRPGWKGRIIRKWIIDSGPGTHARYLAAEGIDCWLWKDDNDSDEHGGIKRFDTPEEAYEEWTTKHREPWRKAMKELGWKFWGEAE